MLLTNIDLLVGPSSILVASHFYFKRSETKREQEIHAEVVTGTNVKINEDKLLLSVDTVMDYVFTRKFQTQYLEFRFCQ